MKPKTPTTPYIPFRLPTSSAEAFLTLSDGAIAAAQRGAPNAAYAARREASQAYIIAANPAYAAALAALRVEGK